MQITPKMKISFLINDVDQDIINQPASFPFVLPCIDLVNNYEHIKMPVSNILLQFNNKMLEDFRKQTQNMMECEPERKKRKVAFHKAKFEETLEELKKWIDFNKRLPRVKKNYKNESEKRLSTWISNKRQHYKKNKLSKEVIQKLQSLPYWYWDIPKLGMTKNFFKIN